MQKKDQGREGERERERNRERVRERETSHTPTVSTGGSLVELFTFVAFCMSQAMWENVKSK